MQPRRQRLGDFIPAVGGRTDLDVDVAFIPFFDLYAQAPFFLA